MISPPALLDTDVLSAVMRRHPVAVQRAQEYLAAHSQFTFSIITRYGSITGAEGEGSDGASGSL